MTKTLKIDFVSDVSCPWCVIGLRALQQAADRLKDAVALDLHFQRGRIKVEIGLAKGKKQYDKRDSEKERDWVREKARLMRVKA